MQKWEYKVVPVKDAGSWLQSLDELGAEGWELVAVEGGNYYFKRAKVEKPPTLPPIRK